MIAALSCKHIWIIFTLVYLNTSRVFRFWDMLCMAVFYVDKKFPTSEGYISIEYVIIFLLLHVLDPLVRPSPSATSQYDTMWPASMEIDSQISPSSPRSPTSSSKRLHLSNSPPSSPPAMSPRSAKNLASGPKYSKSSSQHMQTLKRKLPLILTSLACDMNILEELRNSRDDVAGDLQNLSSGISNQTMSTAMLSGRAFDSLRLILGGGNAFEVECSKLSSLHPALSSLDANMLPDVMISCTDVLTWLENYLTCNEVFYPSGVFNPSSPSLSAKDTTNKVFFPSPGTVDQAIGSIISPKVIDDYSQSGSYPRYIAGQSMIQQPQRVINPVSSLSRSNATLVHGCNSSTYIHVVSDEIPPASSPSFMQLQSYSDDRQDLATLLEKQDLGDKPNGSDLAMSEGELTDVSDKDLVLKIPRFLEPFTSPDLSEKIDRLPSLSVGNCVKSTVYLISPYAAGSISSCRDCDIIIGPVSGVLVMIGCEKVRLSVACRKLILFNCIECDIHIANLSPTVIIGDSRLLSFGKSITAYAHCLFIADDLWIGLQLLITWYIEVSRAICSLPVWKD
jgi:hypothetical protein